MNLNGNEEQRESAKLQIDVSFVLGTLYGDTGESGETYDVEVKA